MTKRLNTQSVENELREASLFFQQPATPPAEPSEQPTTSPQSPLRPPEATESTSVRPSAPPESRTPVRRKLTRMPFEFYQDQLDRLRRIALEEKLRGGKGSMSEMVRQALDRYLDDVPPREGE